MSGAVARRLLNQSAGYAEIDRPGTPLTVPLLRAQHVAMTFRLRQVSGPTW